MSYATMPLNELRTAAQLALAAKSAACNLFFRNAWSRVNEVIASRARRDARDFEVYHAIEVARRKLWEAMCGGASADDCERIALEPGGECGKHCGHDSCASVSDAEKRDELRNEIANTGDC